MDTIVRRLIAICALVILPATACVNYQAGIARLKDLRQRLISNPDDREALEGLFEMAESVDALRLPPARALAVLEDVIRTDPPRFAPTVVPFLIRLSQSREHGVRRGIAQCIGTFGAEARPATEVLLRFIKENRDQDVAYLSASALVGIKADPQMAVPALMELVPGRDPYTQEANRMRGAEVDALGDYGSDARMAIPLLKAALADSDDSYRSAVVLALAKIDPTTKELLPGIGSLLGSTSIVNRYRALKAAVLIRPEERTCELTTEIRAIALGTDREDARVAQAVLDMCTASGERSRAAP